MSCGLLISGLWSFFSIAVFITDTEILTQQRDQKQGNHLARDVRITARDGVIRLEDLHINVNTRVGVEGQNDEYDFNLAGDSDES